MLTEADIRVEPLIYGGEMWFTANGPDGHTYMLKRKTEDAARRDGLAYFLRTRVEHNGRWYIKGEDGKPFCDSSGKPFGAVR